MDDIDVAVMYITAKIIAYINLALFTIYNPPLLFLTHFSLLCFTLLYSALHSSLLLSSHRSSYCLTLFGQLKGAWDVGVL
jgi:hypothetical protein